MSDRLVAEAGTYTTHNTHNRQTSMLSADIEPAIPVIEERQKHALDRTDTRIGA
jgi:hypothetical protein